MIESSGPIDAVFVYGTLKRGRCRESAWPLKPQEVTKCWIHGCLFGRVDYPALLPGDHCVRGEVWAFDSNEVPSVIQALDRIEGTQQNSRDDLYHRHIVDCYSEAGDLTCQAYAYFYNCDPVVDRFTVVPIIDGYQVWPSGRSC